MSIYPIPVLNNGIVNVPTINVSDYKTSSAVLSAVKIFNDGRYLRNSLAVSSASTFFQSVLPPIGGITTLGNPNVSGPVACASVACASLDVSGLLHSQKSADSPNLSMAWYFIYLPLISRKSCSILSISRPSQNVFIYSPSS
jgi:hypothetical protein